MAKLKKAPVALIIMDGWGKGDSADKNNAIADRAMEHLKLFEESIDKLTAD